MQKIRITEFISENRQFEVGKKLLQTDIVGYIFIYVQIRHYSGDDRQLSPLTKTWGIPCLIWETLRLLLFSVYTLVSTKIHRPEIF